MKTFDEKNEQEESSSSSFSPRPTTRSSLLYMQQRRRLWAESRSTNTKLVPLLSDDDDDDTPLPTPTKDKPMRRLGNRRNRPEQTARTPEEREATPDGTSVTTLQLAAVEQTSRTDTPPTLANNKTNGPPFSHNKTANAAAASASAFRSPPLTTTSTKSAAKASFGFSRIDDTPSQSAVPPLPTNPPPLLSMDSKHAKETEPSRASKGFLDSSQTTTTTTTATPFNFNSPPSLAMKFTSSSSSSSSAVVTNPFTVHKAPSQPATTPFSFALSSSSSSSSSSSQPTALQPANESSSSNPNTATETAAALKKDKSNNNNNNNNTSTSIHSVARSSPDDGNSLGVTKTSTTGSTEPTLFGFAATTSTTNTEMLSILSFSSQAGNDNDNDKMNPFASLGASLGKDLPKPTSSLLGMGDSSPSFIFSSSTSGFTASPFSSNAAALTTATTTTSLTSSSTTPLAKTNVSSDQSYRERLVAFYQKHNPEKIPNVDKTLEKYKGKEQELFTTLQRKYATYPNAAGEGPILCLDTTLGRIVVCVFFNAVPKAAANFASLCTGTTVAPANRTRLTTYHNTPIHRIVPDLLIQGGDTTTGDGTGGRSAFDVPVANDMWGHFNDEDFMVHDRPGLLSMANTGPNSNSSQFFITCKALPHLNGKHVVFGEVIEGMDVVLAMVKLPIDEKQRPLQDLKILDCGEFQLDGNGENDQCHFSKVDCESNRISKDKHERKESHPMEDGPQSISPTNGLVRSADQQHDEPAERAAIEASDTEKAPVGRKSFPLQRTNESADSTILADSNSASTDHARTEEGESKISKNRRPSREKADTVNLDDTANFGPEEQLKLLPNATMHDTIAKGPRQLLNGCIIGRCRLQSETRKGKGASTTITDNNLIHRPFACTNSGSNTSEVPSLCEEGSWDQSQSEAGRENGIGEASCDEGQQEVVVSTNNFELLGSRQYVDPIALPVWVEANTVSLPRIRQVAKANFSDVLDTGSESPGARKHSTSHRMGSSTRGCTTQENSDAQNHGNDGDFAEWQAEYLAVDPLTVAIYLELM